VKTNNFSLTNYMSILVFIFFISACGGGGGAEFIEPEVVESTKANPDYFGGLEAKEPRQVIPVLGNDEGKDIALSCVSDSSAGALIELSEDKQSIWYTPKPYYTGTDSFIYQIIDKDSNVSSTKVTVRMDADKNYVGAAPLTEIVSEPSIEVPPGIIGPVNGVVPGPNMATQSSLDINTLYRIPEKPALADCFTGFPFCKPAEQHVHKLSLEVGVSYDIQLEYLSRGDNSETVYPEVLLFDSDVKWLYDGTFPGEWIRTIENFEPKRSEDHYLVVESAMGAEQVLPVFGPQKYTVLLKVRDDYTKTLDTQGWVGRYPKIANLEREADEDWFKTSLNQGFTYTFFVNKENQTAAGNLEISIRDQDGGILVRSEMLGTNQLIYTIPGDIGNREEYYIVIRSTNNYTGPFSVYVEGGDIPNNLNTSAKIEIGQALQGQLGSRGDSDWYKSFLYAGEPYRIRQVGKPTDDDWIRSPRITVRDVYGDVLFSHGNPYPAGSICLPDCKSIANIDFVAPYTGVFYFSASVEPVNRRTPGGLFELSLLPLETLSEQDFPSTVETKAYIATRIIQNGELETAGDRDWYKFYKSPYETYTFTLKKPETGSLFGDGRLSVFDENEIRLPFESKTNPDGSISLEIGAETPYDYGYYFLEVASASNNIGQYRLSREGGDVADHINSWIPIGVGGEITSALNRRLDQDFYRLKIAANSDYQIIVESEFDSLVPAGAIDLVVIGEDQSTLYEADGQEGRATLINTNGTDAEQTVFIIVRSGATSKPEGTYKLSVRNLSNENLCAL
jgi:hypothetical protein